MSKSIEGGELTIRFSKAESEILETALGNYLRLAQEKFPDTRTPARVLRIQKKISKAKEAGEEIRREWHNNHTRKQRAAKRLTMGDVSKIGADAHRHVVAAQRMAFVTEKDVPR